jgi:peroxisomal enoyl-CoA hydratase 2
VILHGLSTYGFAARAILNAVGGGKPSALRYFGVRFTAPVMPGDELETRAWAVKSGSDGVIEVAFEVKNLTTEKVRLFAGMDLVRGFSLSSRSSLVVVSQKWSRRKSLGYERAKTRGYFVP